MVAATCVPTTLYPYIHKFLVENGLHKTAKYFIRETNGDYVCPSGLSLVDIFNKYFNEIHTNKSSKTIKNSNSNGASSFLNDAFEMDNTKVNGNEDEKVKVANPKKNKKEQKKRKHVAEEVVEDSGAKKVKTETDLLPKKKKSKKGLYNTIINIK